ncbi:hypothetical protein LEP1GSC074_0617 [Leptospira noguchii str. Hook]|uniref:Uncharacterized protein n=1 Tax=Leptospira noguchii serovar Autumnalis str. ZUN142 TaxID=1085540 RepID=M6UG64_9LEPT|nr:hypothetical protein LEP1GSC041_3925 [Leptospira noguchii str. 2006001870]EMO41816.1 hypothetical protein LEP1GSC186_2032 [Leptospira noguchii serovar Autumnalis str. ZUN142]EMS83646.1 hypothetical protein LEP1GSC073_2312 [Leptospira noguchii str. Cascata]EMS86777.1 hypothetical protein LEP1GSC074_0617 [Leptospira noguchii str. Hook]
MNSSFKYHNKFHFKTSLFSEKKYSFLFQFLYSDFLEVFLKCQRFVIFHLQII